MNSTISPSPSLSFIHSFSATNASCYITQSWYMVQSIEDRQRYSKTTLIFSVYLLLLITDWLCGFVCRTSSQLPVSLTTHTLTLSCGCVCTDWSVKHRVEEWFCRNTKSGNKSGFFFKVKHGTGGVNIFSCTWLWRRLWSTPVESVVYICWISHLLVRRQCQEDSKGSNPTVCPGSEVTEQGTKVVSANPWPGTGQRSVMVCISTLLVQGDFYVAHKPKWVWHS